MQGGAMLGIFRWAMVWVAVCTTISSDPVAGQDQKPKQIEGWGEVVDPDGDCRVSKDNEDLIISVPKTRHDLTYADKRGTLNAPRVVQPVEGDFTLEVTVPEFPLPGDAASSGGEYSFVSAGLVVWQDDKNFIRLERAAVGNSDAPFVWIEQFTDGQSTFQKLAPLDNAATGLRAVRKGNEFEFQYDADGERSDWVEIRSGAIEMPAKLNVGVAAVNTTAREHPARLTGLKLDAKK
jgi:regulation of enolase protein 1 (concanavalin A-like superfamily)